MSKKAQGQIARIPNLKPKHHEVARQETYCQQNNGRRKKASQSTCSTSSNRIPKHLFVMMAPVIMVLIAATIAAPAVMHRAPKNPDHDNSHLRYYNIVKNGNDTQLASKHHFHHIVTTPTIHKSTPLKQTNVNEVENNKNHKSRKNAPGIPWHLWHLAFILNQNEDITTTQSNINTETITKPSSNQILSQKTKGLNKPRKISYKDRLVAEVVTRSILSNIAPMYDIHELFKKLTPEAQEFFKLQGIVNEELDKRSKDGNPLDVELIRRKVIEAIKKHPVSDGLFKDLNTKYKISKNSAVPNTDITVLDVNSFSLRKCNKMGCYGEKDETAKYELSHCYKGHQLCFFKTLGI